MGGLGSGILFSLTPPASSGGAWTQNTLYEFFGGFPVSSPVMGANGVLYGTTPVNIGGSLESNGNVYSLTPPTSPTGKWTLTTLYTFMGGNDGCDPQGNLAMDGNGVLYGVTTGCGAADEGTIFSLTPPAAPGASWTETLLYTFGGAPDGANPQAGVITGSGGVLYGTTSLGGAANLGTVFSLTPATVPGGSWTEAILYSFAGKKGHGVAPNGGLALSTVTGTLYGVTEFTGLTRHGVHYGSGAVFELKPPAMSGGAWAQAIQHTFQGSDGAYPSGGLAEDAKGMLYGVTVSCGASGQGTVFSITP